MKNNNIRMTLRLPVLTDVVVEGRAVVVDDDEGERFWAIRDATTALEVAWDYDDIDDLVNDDAHFQWIDEACEKALAAGTIEALKEDEESP